MTVAEYAALCSKETTTFHHTSVKKSKEVRKNRSENEDFPETHTATAVCTYLSYCILILYGHVRDFLRRIGLMKHGKQAIKDVSIRFYRSSDLYFYLVQRVRTVHLEILLVCF